MTWRERDHPRDPHTGEFIGKDWVGALAGRLDSRRAGGSDRKDELERDLAAKVPEYINASGTVVFGQDELLREIMRRQGYDGLPEVVDRDSMDRMVASGRVIETWRGLTPSQQPVAQLAEQYRGGDYYIGKGIYGNGVYVTTEQQYARDLLRSGDGDDGLLRIGLRSDARIAEYRDLEQPYDQYSDDRVVDLIDRVRSGHGLTETETAELASSYLWRDPGRLGSALGYDAIRVPQPTGAFYIILNRTATVVQEAE